MTDIQVTEVSEPDEDVFILDVPDDALERAALSDGRIVTLVYCTNDYFSCLPQYFASHSAAPL